jgi:hypothetical protein
MEEVKIKFIWQEAPTLLLKEQRKGRKNDRRN